MNMLSQSEIDELLGDQETIETNTTNKEEKVMRSNIVTVYYTTEETYKECKGVEVNYRFTEGALEVFNYIPGDAILFTEMLYNDEPWTSKKAVANLGAFITTNKQRDTFKFKQEYIGARPPVKAKAVEVKEVVEAPPVIEAPPVVEAPKPVEETKVIKAPKVPKAKEVVEVKAKAVEVKEAVKVPKTPKVKGPELYNPLSTKNQQPKEVIMPIKPEMKIVVESPVVAVATPVVKVTQPIAPTTIKEEVNMSVVQAIAKEMGIEVKGVEESVQQMEAAKVREALEFLAKEGSPVAKDFIESSIKAEDMERLIKTIQYTLGNVEKDATKGFDVKAKAAEFGNAVKSNGLQFLGWAKEQGMKLLGFVWTSIKFIWKHAVNVVVATVGFGGDVLSILFRHLGEIFGEVSEAAQTRYAPVFAKA